MKKIITLFVLCLSFIGLLFIGLNVKADATFNMENGASIRTTGNAGLKFKATISELPTDSTHGFILVKGNHTKSEITAAVNSSATKVGDDTIVIKEVVGTDTTFSVVIYNIGAEYYGQEISVLAYTHTESGYSYADAVQVRNIAEVARTAYQNSNQYDNDDNLVYSIANACRVKVTHSNGTISYSNDYNELTFQNGDVIDLSRGTYNNPLNIDASNVIINGVNKDNKFNWTTLNREIEKNETIINNVINIYGVDNVSINGLTIRGTQLTDSNPAGYWRSSSSNMDSSSYTRLHDDEETYISGIVLWDSHTNITITNNYFDMISDARYAIVDNCKNNIDGDSYKLNTTYNKNLNISNNYFDFANTTTATSDIFIRSKVTNSIINNNYFKNSYTTGTTTFSYDYCIRLGRIGDSSESNQTLEISENIFNHNKCTYGIDLGIYANAIKDDFEVRIFDNNYVSSCRRCIRISNAKAKEHIYVEANTFNNNYDSTANYTMRISSGTSATAKTLTLADHKFKYNKLNGTPVLQYGLLSITSCDVCYNYYNGGSSSLTQDGNYQIDASNGECLTNDEYELAYRLYHGDKELYQDILKSIGYEFYYQGNQIQYDQSNSRRNLNSAPEDATEYKGIYLDCSSYTNSIYNYVFGINVTSSVSTKNFDTFAKNNYGTNDEIVYYVETKNYTTNEAKSNLLQEIWDNLQVGDLICYRHGESSGSSGHVMMYIGNDTLLHCTGSSYQYNDDPTKSYDNPGSTESTKGAILTLQAKYLFTCNQTSSSYAKRYLFNDGTTATNPSAAASNKVWSFEVIRPIERENLEVNYQAFRHYLNSGLTIEKRSETPHMSTVGRQEVITYYIDIKNNSSTTMKNINVTDIINNLCTYKTNSIDNNGIVEGNNVSWTIPSLAKNATITVSYQVIVNSDAEIGSCIESNNALVNGIKTNKIYHTIGGFTESNYTTLTNYVSTFLNSDYSGDTTDGFKMAYDFYYNSLGYEIVDENTTAAEIENSLIYSNKNNTITKTSEYYPIVNPNFYGGLFISSGMVSDNNRIRLVKNDFMELGDIIIVYNQNLSKNITYIYIDSSTILGIENNKVVNLFDTEEEVSTFLLQLIAYDRYVVLRPTLNYIPE